jgi:hypothetical protein
MAKITSKDIEKIRQYQNKIKELRKEEPASSISNEEWDEFYKLLKETGKFPEKYRGRIGANEVEVWDGVKQVKDENGNLILDEEGLPVYEHYVLDEPEIRTAYYDIELDAYYKKFEDLNKESREAFKNILLTYDQKHKEGISEEEITDIAEIIAELLEDPEIREELEKKAKFNEIAPLGSIPNGEALNWLYRVITSSKGGRIITSSNGNRHEEITATEKKGIITFTRKNKQNGSTVIVAIEQADKYLQKSNKTFIKVLLFSLQKMTTQNFPLKVGFSLQELVDLGMYSTTSNAGRAVKEFFAQQKLTTLSGIVKKGKKTVKEEGGVLFYHYDLDNGYVTLSVNDNFNMEFIANYFTVFPRFAYALSNNAFSLVRYIFFLARQNAQAIKDKGTFTINLDSIRENLGLPPVDEVKNRKYKQYIIDPIETAIEEIEEALLKAPEAKEYGFTITPYGTDTKNIKQWLQGYLEIGLKNDFAETFIKIATKAEKDRAQWDKIKKAELARIAARQEAKKHNE